MKCLKILTMLVLLTIGRVSAQTSTPSSVVPQSITLTPAQIQELLAQIPGATKVLQELPAPPPVVIPLPPVSQQLVTATAVMWIPKFIVTGGVGFVSPNGKFVYGSESNYLGSGTYTTVAVEETLVNGTVESCTLAGITKPMYQYSIFTVGLTGLGGGCVKTTGNSGAIGQGQGFLDIRFGHSNFGIILSGTRSTTDSTWKFTLAPRWAQ